MATAVQKITLSSSRDIPFNKLVLSQSNVRRVKAGVSIEELAEDIARRTLLQSPNVLPVLDAEGIETGMFEVPAGGRRYRALQLLVKQKRLAKTAPVPCVVRDRSVDISAEEDSLAENIQRASLHPLDQFRAFQALRQKGQSEEEIAAAFFVGVNVVKQRLRLAAVSEKLLDSYAEDGMSLEQLMAFTVTNDHARQEQIWEALQHSYSQEPYQIRRMLTERTARASDRRALFVGIARAQPEKCSATGDQRDPRAAIARPKPFGRSHGGHARRCTHRSSFSSRAPKPGWRERCRGVASHGHLYEPVCGRTFQRQPIRVSRRRAGSMGRPSFRRRLPRCWRHIPRSPKIWRARCYDYPDGPAPRFGSCFFLLRRDVAKRSIFTFGGSHEDCALERTGTLDVIEPVFVPLLSQLESGNGAFAVADLSVRDCLTRMVRTFSTPLPDPASRPLGRALDSFIEVQVHGELRLRDDVEQLVADPTFRDDLTGEILAGILRTYGIPLGWHPGYRMPVRVTQSFSELHLCHGQLFLRYSCLKLRGVRSRNDYVI